MAENGKKMDGDKSEFVLRQDKFLSVVQANRFIRAKQDDLSLLEIKLLRLVIGQLMLDDKGFRTYTTHIVSLADFLGISRENIYRDIKKLSVDLLHKVILIESESGKRGHRNFTGFHWVSLIRYEDGWLTIRLSDEISEFLLGLRGWFTSYQLENIIRLPTTRSIRLFELLSSFRNMIHDDCDEQEYHEISLEKNEVLFSLNFLRGYFNCEEKYRETKDFMRYVIKTSVKEINTCTDIHVSYRVQKQGNSIKYVIFKIN